VSFVVFHVISASFCLSVMLESLNLPIHVSPTISDMNHDTEFWQTWREGIVDLANLISEARPETGFWLANCPYHVAESKDWWEILLKY